MTLSDLIDLLSHLIEWKTNGLSSLFVCSYKSTMEMTRTLPPSGGQRRRWQQRHQCSGSSCNMISWYVRPQTWGMFAIWIRSCYLKQFMSLNFNIVTIMVHKPHISGFWMADCQWTRWWRMLMLLNWSAALAPAQHTLLQTDSLHSLTFFFFLHW